MSSTHTTHRFTCNSCKVAFKTSDLQRTHMQSDWHRYNLKRRVASLPPLSSEIFAEKVLASKADAAATAARASFERLCESCQKTYYSENAFNNHLNSSKHKANLVKAHQAKHRANADEDEARSIMSSTFSLGKTSTAQDEGIDDDAEEEFEQVVNGFKNTDLNDDEDDPVSRRPSRPHHSAGPEGQADRDNSLSASNATEGKRAISGKKPKEQATRECLFCNEIAEGLAENITHMSKTHGLFIPERQYLVDLEGLIYFLNRKVYDYYQCLSCHRLKWSEDGIKQHMRDLGHCRIGYESEEEQLEIGDFYDFRSTYSDGEEDDEDLLPEGNVPGGGVKLGAKREATTTVDDDDEADGSEIDEGGWETDSTASSVPTEELGALYCDDDKAEKYGRLKTHKHHSHNQKVKHHSADGFHSHAHSGPNAVYHDEFELHLPTGRIAGHRTLNRYYRQNLRNYPTPEERRQRLLTAGDDNEEEERGRGRGRQLVSRADGGLGMLFVNDSKKKQVKAMEKKERRREGRMMAKVQWRTDKIGNSQKHFRDPLLQ